MPVLRRLWNAYVSWEGLWFLVLVILGTGCILYVGVSWLVHWIHRGRYLLALCASISMVLFVVAAAGRVPIALAVVFAVAVTLGTLFLSGNGDAVLP